MKLIVDIYIHVWYDAIMMKKYTGTNELVTHIDTFERKLEGEVDVSEDWSHVIISRTYYIDGEIDFLVDRADEELAHDTRILQENGFNYDDLGGDTTCHQDGDVLTWSITIYPN